MQNKTTDFPLNQALKAVMRNRRAIPDSEIPVQFGFGVMVISCEFNAGKYDSIAISA